MIDYFGEAIAATYDRNTAEQFAPELVTSTVDVLAELAGAGGALELGIGTGRIALPLAARGVPVHGIEFSAAMVERLREKPGGAEIGVTIGDFTSTRVDGDFALAYLVFNTIMNLTTQDAQVACFRAVAGQLAPGGCFVVEVMVPELRKLPAGQTVVPFGFGPERWAYSDYDPATQAVVCHYLDIAGGTHRSIPFRYVWPAELDLMARLAGLELRHRWADWERRPFTGESGQHVSVWAKADSGQGPGR
ncbi:class I SAM-dependent DNA methyltransferase [Nocardia sp. NPDC057227]|uniref:class I SAM-dependent DNA methyltransferase n=1 Tax=Nocardia sp. NPDC057227 TaxID=3346056 RepID=UPI00362785B2